MASTIRIRMGQLEVEWEGSEDFLKNELPALLTAISILHQQIAATPASSRSGSTSETSELSSNGAIVGTTAALSAKLGVKSGSELVVAAAARLTLVLNKTSFTRTELIAEMRSATGYFNENQISNLTKILKALVASQKLNEVSANTYALKAS